MKFKLSSPELDKWNGEDKVVHFTLSAVQAAIFCTFYSHINMNYPAACAFVVVILIGIIKEVIDALTEKGSGFSFKDLVADVMGSALGVSTAAALLM